MTAYIILGILAVLLLFVLVAYNSLVMLRNKVKEAFATMDVSLKKRYDLIPALVEVVKGYAGHEAQTLEKVTQMRGVAAGNNDLNGQIASEVRIGDTLKTLFAVVEAYPDLKANNSFLTLQQQLSQMEDEIALSRRYYNGSVREYNNRCQVFPYNLIASLFNFKDMPMFSVGSASERQVVEVKL